MNVQQLRERLADLDPEAPVLVTDGFGLLEVADASWVNDREVVEDPAFLIDISEPSDEPFGEVQRD